MDTPVFTDGEFVNASLLNGAVSSLVSDVQDIGSILHTPGLLNPTAMTVTPNNMVVTIAVPDPFAVLFGSGVLASAHGTTDGADTTTYALNMAPLVPGSGSVTAYVLAQYQAIGSDLITVVGPPPGHPDYNPNFNPFEFYSTQRASLKIVGTTAAPDNETTFELFRVTLSAGQTSIQSAQIDKSHWVYASAVLNPTGVTAGQYAGATITVGVDGRITAASAVAYGPLAGTNTWTGANSFTQEITAGGVKSTTLDDSGLGGQFRAVQGNYGMLIRNDGTHVYFMQTAENSPNGGYNSYRPFAWDLSTGNVTIAGDGATTQFGGPIVGQPTITDPGPYGLILAGSTASGATFKMQGNGGLSKFLRVVSNTFEVLNNALTTVLMQLDDNGNVSFQGSISGASLTTSGSITAEGRMFAANGAFGTGNSEAVPTLADYIANYSTTNFGYTRRPDGLIEMTTTSGVPVTNGLQTTLVALPTAFTHACADAIISFSGNTPPLNVAISVQPYDLSHVAVTTNGTGNGTVGVVIRARGT